MMTRIQKFEKQTKKKIAQKNNPKKDEDCNYDERKTTQCE
jgi:hypothetical protein